MIASPERRRAAGRRNAALPPCVAAALLAAGCITGIDGYTGAPCEVTRQCEAGLLCRLDRCRVPCESDAECENRGACVRDEDHPDQRVCTLVFESPCYSYCPDSLVCAASGTCRNPCASWLDCGAGRACELGVCVDSRETGDAASDED